MKANELFVLSVIVTGFYNSCICQTEHLLQSVDSTNTSQSSGSNVFKLFTGGINAIYSGDRARGGVELSVQTYHYYLVTGKYDQKDTIKNKIPKSKTLLSPKQQYKGFEFFLLNRASINFDTSGLLANDYVTSLQASPLTLRFVKEYFLTKQKAITTTSYSPVISIKVTTDGRAVPFTNDRDDINIGASGHVFLTLSTQFTRLEFDQKGKELDRGTMYFQPSIGFAIGSGELMKSVFNDQANKLLLSSECRLGFKSHAKTVNDCSFLVRYTPADIAGPKLRAGVILSSFN